jgi:ribonucleotide reductase beta subunit family protein with ferritin-like domain
MMCKYIEFVADGFLKRLYISPIYKSDLPAGMEFMNKLNFNDMPNMFEQRSTNYALASIHDENNDDDLINEDF